MSGSFQGRFSANYIHKPINCISVALRILNEPLKNGCSEDLGWPTPPLVGPSWFLRWWFCFWWSWVSSEILPGRKLRRELVWQHRAWEVPARTEFRWSFVGGNWRKVMNNPIGSMGLIYLPCIYHKNQPNVGRYSIHGSWWQMCLILTGCFFVNALFFGPAEHILNWQLNFVWLKLGSTKSDDDGQFIREKTTCDGIEYKVLSCAIGNISWEVGIIQFWGT